MLKRRATIVWAFCLASLFAHLPVEARELRWLGLFNAELVGWLENENRLNELCPGSTESPEGCKRSVLRPKTITLDILADPKGPRIGFLEIQSTPGKGLDAFVIKAGSATRVQMLPDLFDADWGYGPYFHQTVLDSLGPSVLLPFDSLMQAAWIDARQLGSAPEYRSIQQGQIYSIGGQSVVILSVSEKGIMVREEQAGDMWCAEGQPPPLQKAREWHIDNDELYNESGHLKLKVKYTRGC